MNDGFYVVDIVDHLTDEFSLAALKQGERLAASEYDWVGLTSRHRSFRNALLSVALEQQCAVATPIPALGPTHVLIVDELEDARNRHWELVRRIAPDANIMCCSRWAPELRM